MIALVFSLITASVFAQAPTDQWGVNDEQMKVAPCYRREPFTEAEMNRWLSDERGVSIGETVTVKGIRLENENPKLVRALRLLIENPKLADFTSSCRSVKCAVQQIFGAKPGLQLLFMIERFGFNGSEYTNQNVSAWTAEELDRVLLALAAYPENTFPQVLSRPINHFQRGFSPAKFSEDDMKTVVADSRIMFYAPWDSHTPEAKSFSVVHEVAHLFSVWTKDFSQQKAWTDIDSGWTRGEKESWVAKDPSAYVSKYAFSDPDEDFAESVATYRFNPNELKKRSPKKYELIKNFYYDGLEYTSAEACAPSAASSEKLKRVVVQALTGAVDEGSLLKVQTDCGEIALSALGNQPYSARWDARFRSCAGDAMKKSLIASARKRLWPNEDYAIQAKVLMGSILDSKVPEEWKDQAANRLKEVLSDILVRAAREIFAKAMGIHQGSCEIAAQYSDQSIGRADPQFSKRFGSTSDIYAFNFQKQFDALMLPVCERLKASYRNSKQVSDEQARAEISKFLN